MKYHHHIPMIYPWDKITASLDISWEQGRCQNGILWPVKEARVPRCEWSEALEDFAETPVERMFFSMIQPGGLPVHRDHNRLCCLNFPLVVEDTARTIFVDDFDQILEEFLDSHPVLMNTRQLHGVVYPSFAARVVLSVSFYEPYKERLKRPFRNNELFRVEPE